jgi:hypothetical protein
MHLTLSFFASVLLSRRFSVQLLNWQKLPIPELTAVLRDIVLVDAMEQVRLSHSLTHLPTSTPTYIESRSLFFVLVHCVCVR